MQLTVKDAAKALNVAEKTVYRWIQSGGLPAYRVAGQYRINRAMLFDWASSKSIPLSSDAPASEPVIRDLPCLSDALRAGGIHRLTCGLDKASVLKAAVELLRLPDHVNRDFLYQALMAREQLQSTGIGDGVAIPHMRNPAVLELATPLVGLCFLRTPIEFNAIDGRPVSALFFPLSPDVHTHLHLLSRISFALRNPRVKGILAAQSEDATLLDALTALEA